MNSRESSSPPPAGDPPFLTGLADLDRSRSGPGGALRRVADVNAPLINIPGQRPLLDLFPLFFPSESEAPPPLATRPITQAREALPTYEAHRSSVSVIDQPIVDLAAGALDLPPPFKARRRVLTGLLFVFLLFAGAAAAAYVFQNQLAAILNS